MGGVWFWLVSIGSPGLVAGAADDGSIGMLFARCGLNPCALFPNGLLFNGSPTEAIEICVWCKTPVIVVTCMELKVFRILYQPVVNVR
jgi:hypothetical protein